MGNRLSKIATRTGDAGMTGLGDGSRVEKDHLRICAMGDVDELNSEIGVLMTEEMPESIAAELKELFLQVQHDLFDLGADLAGSKTIKITKDYIDRLELWIDGTNGLLQPLESFVLPTGPIHFARTIVRRAELKVWWATGYEDINELIPQYLNRLSDLLFVMARYHNKGNEAIWVPRNEE